MKQEKKKSSDPQIIVVLRAVAGGYLLYLAWGLREAALSGESVLYLLAMIVFALVGAVLLFFSVRQLIRKDYAAPGQPPETSGEAEPGEPDGEDTEEDDP